ncbi:MAG: hypothetical protein DWQ31_00075 [Planctomycetota bacterium]|nr:MAG: hypothetical protein DWQ31_00075 [Planctomycetota bacterium]REJ93188.1 MAG: hypothetical protein DWQ35_10950 [Planctomycetota bacterium]
MNGRDRNSQPLRPVRRPGPAPRHEQGLQRHGPRRQDPHHRRPAAWLALVLCLVFGAACQQEFDVPDFSQLELSELTAIALDAPLSTAADHDWPGWRGHNASGVSKCGNLATEWDNQEGFRWRRDLEGEGNSSPVVWGDAVLLTTDIDGGLFVDCFSLADGTPRWRARAGSTVGPTHVKNGYAAASVTTDGQRVFAFFGGTGMFCFDLASGEEIWRTDLGELEHYWGTASSPVLFEDLVIQMCDNVRESFIVGLDKESGEEMWRTPRPSHGSWSTPVFVTLERDGKKYVEMVVNGTGTNHSGGGEVLAYDPLFGHPLWSVRGTRDIACPTAIVHEGRIISTTGRRGPIISIEPGGFGDVTDSHVQWRLPRGGPYVPTGLAIDGRLYLVDDSGTMSCYKTASGERVWRQRLGGAFTASLVAGDGKIYATSEEGDVFVVAQGDEFQLLATNSFNQRCLATPAIASDSLLFRTESQLYCIAPLQLAASEPVATEMP